MEKIIKTNEFIDEKEDKNSSFGEVTILLKVTKQARDFCKLKNITYKHIFMLGIESFTQNPALLNRISALETENKKRFNEYYVLRKLYMDLKNELEYKIAEGK